MSIIYAPVLIESAEQAEALPTGTLARHSEGAGMDHAHKLPSTPVLSRSRWISTAGVVLSASMVGWTALVPVEVTSLEEHHRDLDSTRMTYRTPWRTR